MGKDKLSDAELFKTVASAMTPYRCVAEFSDYGARFGFAVYYGDDELERQVFEFPCREIRHARGLIDALNNARHLMSAVGIIFPSWNNHIHK